MRRRGFLQAAAAATLSAGAAAASAASLAGSRAGSSSDSFAANIAGKPLLAPLTGVTGDLDCERLVVQGRWPAELRGRFLRNGPALMARGGQRIGHWFEGDGMVQQFRIDGARINHRGRLVQTAKLKIEAQSGRLMYPSFNGLPAPGVPISGPDSFNVANTNAIEHGGRLLALWEGGSAYALDPDSLGTQGPVTWQPGWEQMPFSAHPKLDAKGTLWNFGTAGQRLVLYQIDAAGRVAQAQVGSLPVRSGMVHDAAVTDRWFVIPLPPVRWSPGSPIGFDARDALRILVVAKHDISKQRVFELPAEMVFHVGNAFERGDGQIELTYMGSAGGDFLVDAAAALMQGRVTPTGRTQTVRVVLDMASGRVERQAFGDETEFPRVHPMFIGRRARYLTSVAGWRPRPLFDHGLQVRDLETGRIQRWDHGELGVAEEAVVVPKPGRSGEAEAWLLATMFDGRRGATTLQLFEMQHLADGPVASAELPYALPYGFHGNFQAA